MESILKISNLSKKYGGEYAVQNLNMHITQGDIYGFLGQNGSGKTTTIRMILGLIKPTSGYVELFGEPMNKTIITCLEELVRWSSILAHMRI